MLTQKLSPRALAVAAFLAAIAWAASPVAARFDPHTAPPPAAKPAGAMPSEVGHAPRPSTPAPATTKTAPPAAAKPSTPASSKPATPKPAPKLAALEDNLPDTPRSAAEALRLLTDGNDRWVTGTPANPNTGALRRKFTADHGQTPFAVILTCADSRIPLERTFDAGVGDLFAIRVAGNVAGAHQAASIEYAVDHLGVPLLVVMGHTRCGAVRAAAEFPASSSAASVHASNNIESLLTAIRPAVERAKKMNPAADEGALLAAAARENVWQSIFDLYKSSPALMHMVRSGKVKVVGAIVDVSTGKVDFMGEHPWQDALISAFNPAPAPTKTAAADPAAADSH